MDVPRTRDHAAAWQDRAACVGLDPELWFPHPSDDAGAAYARSICRACPVAVDCLEAALGEERSMPAAGRAGIRGALSPSERASVYRSRANRRSS